jgi:hypothetical protein
MLLGRARVASGLGASGVCPFGTEAGPPGIGALPSDALIARLFFAYLH